MANRIPVHKNFNYFDVRSASVADLLKREVFRRVPIATIVSEFRHVTL